jgi:predicted DNA-binding transcriptional regulator AlpA
MREKTRARKDMASLPTEGLLRLSQILNFVPVSASTWWAGVKDGRFPKPIKLSPRVTVWTVADIRQLIDRPHAENGDTPHAPA